MGNTPTELKKHFDRISKDYAHAADPIKKIYDLVEKYLEPFISNKKVLDVGNGGYFSYDPNITKSCTVLDISPEMLNRITNNNVEKIVGDARYLEQIKDGSKDVILYFFCIHHIVGDSFKISQNNLQEITDSAFKKLKPGGQVIILEVVTSGIIYYIQRMLYPLTCIILRLYNVPMIFFNHVKNINKHLAKSLTLEISQIKNIHLPFEGSLDPLAGSFPGKIRIPGKMHPGSFVIITATKPVSKSSD